MKTIRVPLSEKGIDNAIKELNRYKTWLKQKTELFLKELGNEGVQIASAKFSEAIYDGTNDVSVSLEERGTNKVAVVAIGGAVLFIEFGSGVRYPDDHPEAAQNGMIRGEYGYGLGKLQSGWRYTGEPGTNGELVTSGKHAGMIHTYGNPANMSMYLTIRELQDKVEEIAKRVFTDD